MRRFVLSVLTISLFISAPGPARAAGEVRAHEFWFGGGGARGFDHAVFDVPDDIKNSPDGFFTVGYLHNLDEHRAFGFHLFGTTEKTPEALLADTSGFYPVRFDLLNYNIGVRGRYTFSRQGVAPSVFGGVNLAFGSIESKKTGELTYSGASFCGGGDLGVPLGRHFMLAAELFGSFGVAKWKNKPFLNSTDADYNPSIAGIAFDIHYLWGRAI